MGPSTPTGLSDPTSQPIACPRCGGQHLLTIGSATVTRAFDWRECAECAYLWVLLLHNSESLAVSDRTPAWRKVSAR